MFKAHRLLYHPTPGLRVIKKKKKAEARYGCGTTSTISTARTRPSARTSKRCRFLLPPISHHAPGHGVKRFRGGLVFKAHRLLYHSTLG